jgi:hypothetical protein
MAKKWTHTEAFESFGVTPRNVRWSWSARNVDNKIVVGTLWQDRFKRVNGKLVYEGVAIDPATPPQKRLAFDEWKENLIWAQDNCEGRIHVIIAIAKDVTAAPRSIKECNPSKMVVKLAYLDRETGAFIAEAEGL